MHEPDMTIQIEDTTRKSLDRFAKLFWLGVVAWSLLMFSCGIFVSRMIDHVSK